MTKKEQDQRKHHITAWQTNKPDHDSRCEARGQSQGESPNQRKGQGMMMDEVILPFFDLEMQGVLKDIPACLLVQDFKISVLVYYNLIRQVWTSKISLDNACLHVSVKLTCACMHANDGCTHPTNLENTKPHCTDTKTLRDPQTSLITAFLCFDSRI